MMRRCYHFLIIILLLAYISHAADTTNIDNATNTNNTQNANNTQKANNTQNSNSTQNGTTTQKICSRPCVTLEVSSCTICYYECKNSSNQVVEFQVRSCELKKCEKWKTQPRSQQERTNTNVICEEWAIQSLSDAKCAQDCCGSIFEQFTHQNINTCLQNDLSSVESSSKISLIIGVVLGSVLFVIIVLALLFCCRKRIKLCFNNITWFFQQPFTKGEVTKHHQQDSTRQSHQQSQDQSKGKTEKTQWKPINKKKQVSQLSTSKYIIQSQYEINPEIYCSICLDDGLNCETACGHHLHFKCLEKKLQEKFVCPQCKSRKLSPIKVICEKCHQKQAEFEITKEDLMKRNLKFLKNNKISCDKCMRY